MVIQSKVYEMNEQEKFINDNLGFLNLIKFTTVTISVSGNVSFGKAGPVFINIGQHMDFITFDELYKSSDVIHAQFDNETSIKIDEYDDKKGMMYYTIIEKRF